MAITSEMIKTLRDKTGAGMMDCKKALEETGGRMDAAIEFLRKKGAAVSAKRADRAAREGMIVTRVSPDGRTGVIVEVNCETDFVGRSDDFVAFAQAVAEAIERERPAGVAALAGLPAAGGRKVGDMLNDLLAKVGEKIEVRRFKLLSAAAGHISSYTHLGNKIGVLVEIAGVPPGASVGRDVAMQIAAMNPLTVARDDVDRGTVERELDIYRTQAQNEGKPAQVVDRIAQGRLEKFFQEVALLEQAFIKDPGKTVKAILQEAGGGSPVAVRGFHRFHLGEELRDAE